MLKTAVIGASGYLGRHLWQSYRRVFPDCLGTGFSNVELGLQRFDIRDPEVTPLKLEETGHQAVLIASARANINYCQQEPSAAYAVNVTGTLELMRRLGRTPLQVIFLSSDYVFKGASGDYDDDEYGGVNNFEREGEHGNTRAIITKSISQQCLKTGKLSAEYYSI